MDPLLTDRDDKLRMSVSRKFSADARVRAARAWAFRDI